MALLGNVQALKVSDTKSPESEPSTQHPKPYSDVVPICQRDALHSSVVNRNADPAAFEGKEERPGVPGLPPEGKVQALTIQELLVFHPKAKCRPPRTPGNQELLVFHPKAKCRPKLKRRHLSCFKQGHILCQKGLGYREQTVHPTY